MEDFPCAHSYAALQSIGNPAILVGSASEFGVIDTIPYWVCKEVGRRSWMNFVEEYGVDESGKLIIPLEWCSLSCRRLALARLASAD